jgi:hypothetical protein
VNNNAGHTGRVVPSAMVLRYVRFYVVTKPMEAMSWWCEVMLSLRPCPRLLLLLVVSMSEITSSPEPTIRPFSRSRCNTFQPTLHVPISNSSSLHIMSAMFYLYFHTQAPLYSQSHSTFTGSFVSLQLKDCMLRGSIVLNTLYSPHEKGVDLLC